VKGDGCNSVDCICGQHFYWSARVDDMKRLVLDAFIAKFGTVDAAAVEAVRILLDTAHFPNEDVRGATYLRELDNAAFTRGQAALWPLVCRIAAKITSLSIFFATAAWVLLTSCVTRFS
jgi:hypothetical protein